MIRIDTITNWLFESFKTTIFYSPQLEIWERPTVILYNIKLLTTIILLLCRLGCNVIKGGVIWKRVNKGKYVVKQNHDMHRYWHIDGKCSQRDSMEKVKDSKNGENSR